MKHISIWVSLAIALSTTACSEGYPPEDDNIHLHFQISQEEAVAALNTLGSREYLKEQTQYQLQDGCQLEIVFHKNTFKKEASVVDLNATEPVLLKSEHGRRLHSVALQSPDGHGEPSTVFFDGTWGDASMVKWLLEHIPRLFCS
jgi:hypothetical protein